MDKQELMQNVGWLLGALAEPETDMKKVRRYVRWIHDEAFKDDD